MASRNSNKRGISPGPRHNPKKSKHHKDFDLKIGKKLWQVRFVGNDEISSSAWGESDLPNAENPKIFVYRCQTKRNLVNTLLHEVLHAVRPELSEEAVTETADILERALDRLGYKL